MSATLLMKMATGNYARRVLFCLQTSSLHWSEYVIHICADLSTEISSAREIFQIANLKVDIRRDHL